jgi:rare lipoprotein A
MRSIFFKTLIFALTAFGSIAALPTSPVGEPDMQSVSRRVERGPASWYGSFHHGRRTASGETFNKNALTAAHKRLPFGTLVRVTYHRTGQSVAVRINDRGPFKAGRIIDLSQAAARSIGLQGVGEVSITEMLPATALDSDPLLIGTLGVQ